jgi:hypothetical protein
MRHGRTEMRNELTQLGMCLIETVLDPLKLLP